MERPLRRLLLWRAAFCPSPAARPGALPLLVLLRMLEEIHNFDELRLGFLDPSHILETFLDLGGLIVDLGAALSECHRTAGALPEFSRAVSVDEHQKQDRDHPGKHAAPPAGL